MESKDSTIRQGSADAVRVVRPTQAPAGSRVFETVHLPRNRTMVVLREDVHRKALAAAQKVMEKHRK